MSKFISMAKVMEERCTPGYTLCDTAPKVLLSITFCFLETVQYLRMRFMQS